MTTVGQTSSPIDVLSVLYSMNETAEVAINKLEPAICAVNQNTLQSPDPECGMMVVTPEATGNTHHIPSSAVSVSHSMNETAEVAIKKLEPAICTVNQNTPQSPDPECGMMVVTPEATSNSNHMPSSAVVSCSSLDTYESINENDKHMDGMMIEVVDVSRQNISQTTFNETKNWEMSTQDTSKLRKKLHAKEEVVKRQRNELEQYRNMAQKYRTSVREKLSQIRTLEKDVYELRRSAVPNDKREMSIPQAIQSEDLDSTPVYVESESLSSRSTTIKQMTNESISQYQIIKSLTTENNALRKREIDHLQDRAPLEKELIVLREKVQVMEVNRDTRTKELELKTGINRSIVRRLTDYESDEKENQVEIANLSQEVFNLQKTVDDGRKEKIVFQKLLSTSRESASLAMSKSMTCGENDGKVEKKNPLSASSIQSEETVVATSLRKELVETKKREGGLLRQLSQRLDQLGVEPVSVEDSSEETKLKQQLRASKSSIMDQLSDSQQEAIVFLSSEVEDLRSQLEVECKEKDKLTSMVADKNQELQILKKENELFASEAVEDETALKALEINLSTQLGQNACLRDEIEELEIKTKKLLEIETELVKKDKECQKLDVKIKALTKLKIAAETVTTTQASSEDLAQSDKSTREVSVLKRALKQTYEKKFERHSQENKNVIQGKDMEITRLKGCIVSQEECISKHKSEINDQIVQNIAFEAEYQEDHENLSNSLNERNRQLKYMRERMLILQQSDASLAWKTVSETVQEGVTASLSALQDLTADSDTNEEEDKRFHLYSRSYG